MSLPNILVTGSNGQLGSELKELAPSHSRFNFHFFSREELPIDNSEVVEKVFAEYKPQYIINCAAYTAVDKAETEREQALAINANAVALLAKISQQYNAKFIHVSTDYVFDGTSEKPLKENDPVSPINFYGESKLRGEQLALKENPDSIIIRTSWVYSFYGKNFVKTMLRLMNERESINVVSDQYGSPTYAADLAEAILHIVESNNWQPGIYNFSNEGIINWAEFAQEIKSQIHSSCTVNFITTDQYPTPAKRPKYSVLDKSKIVSAYGIVLKDWKVSLKECIGKLKKM